MEIIIENSRFISEKKDYDCICWFKDSGCDDCTDCGQVCLCKKFK